MPSSKAYNFLKKRQQIGKTRVYQEQSFVLAWTITVQASALALGAEDDYQSQTTSTPCS